MKVAWFALLALAGTTLASPPDALQARGLPEAGSPQARELFDMVKKGMLSWGLAGAIRPLSGHSPGPVAKFPGGLPRLNRPRPSLQDGVPGTPGNPLGPRKKAGRIYHRRKSCLTRKHGGRQWCPGGGVPTGRASRYPKLHLNGRGGVMAAFTTLSPHAQVILAAIKNWDNPIGTTVKWFDEAMADLQESIGGKHVPEIDGNELKLWLICLFRGDMPRNPDVIDRLCKRHRDAPLEKRKQQQRKQQQAMDGLNQIAELCERVEDEAPPLDQKMKADVLALCRKYSETIEGIVDANAGLVLLGEWARARTLNGEEVEVSDRAVVKGFLQKGALGPANESDASAIASLYMEHMSNYEMVDRKEGWSEAPMDHRKPRVLLALLKMRAGFVPEDREAVNEALQMLDNTPHRRHLDKEGAGPLGTVKTCWNHAGLLMFQPRRWDVIAAAMTYLEGKIRDTNSDLACAPCLTPAGYWVLRCGSAEP